MTTKEQLLIKYSVQCVMCTGRYASVRLLINQIKTNRKYSVFDTGLATSEDMIQDVLISLV